MASGIDLIWFGVAPVVLIELGQLKSPFGINLFVIKRILGAPLGELVVGTVPDCGLIIGILFLLYCVPSLVTWLLGAMFEG